MNISKIKKQKSILYFVGFFLVLLFLSSHTAFAALPKTFLFPNEFFKPKKALFTATYENPTGDFTQIPSTKCQYTESEGSELKYTAAESSAITIPKDGSYQAWADIYNHSDIDIGPQGETFTITLTFNPTGVAGGNKDIVKTVPALLIKQRVYFDLGYVLKGSRDFTLKFEGAPKSVLNGADKRIAICEFGISDSGKVSDVIGVKVFANPLHLSAEQWYKSGTCRNWKVDTIDNVCFSDSDCKGFKCNATTLQCNNPDATACAQDSDCQSVCNFNILNRGATSQVTVDGFTGVKSGRTTYVNATNFEGGKLYTNIYLLSYNENASEETQAIFKDLLKNLKFMDNEPDADKRDIFRRDTVRFSDLRSMQLLLRDYQRKKGYYPLWDNVRKTLSGGTYVPGVSISTWPSWKNTFAKELKVTLPTDPINTIKTCPNPCCAANNCAVGFNLCNADPKTCWDEKSLKLSCPTDSPNSFYYTYKIGSAERYTLGVNFEYTDGGNWNALLPIGNLSLDSLIIDDVCTGISADDLDNDGVPDTSDNCPPSKCTTPLMCANPMVGGVQPDADNDSLGDLCDVCPNSLGNDQDHDGVCEDVPDNCPAVFNPDQKNSDYEEETASGKPHLGDACDTLCQKDSDKDNVCDEIDNCPFVFNPNQANSDGGGCCPPATPRFCTSDTSYPGYVCSAGGNGDAMCYDDRNGNGLPDDDPDPGLFNHCKTPDQMAGQVWPNGKEFGDACDPNTDTDADGFGTGFCGAYSTGDYTGYPTVDFRICHIDADCATYNFPAGVSVASTGVEQNKCSMMPASKSAGVKLDNCTTGDFYSANPGQEDFDKDLVGYFCDLCIDTDKDEFTDTIVNEGFENGAGKWNVLLSNGASVPLDISNNFRHLNNTLWEDRTTADTSYRGIHAAHLYLEKDGLKKIINKIMLGGPVRVPSGIVNDRVYYTMRAYVRSSVFGNQITMKAMRGCTNDVSTAILGIPYSAGCKEGLNVFGEAVNVSNDWTPIEIEFYINYLGAQNEVALIFEASTRGDYYIDDIQVFYKANIGGATADSCGEKKPDNCINFNNPLQCVGGEKNGTVCTLDANCLGADGASTLDDGVCIQPDRDEDNSGDSCDMCTDRDGDGWGDPGYTIKNCAKSFNVADNCPITPNLGQEDTDNDAKICVFTGSIPYKTKQTYATCVDDPKNFDPKKCDFCGGDACDLDADGDKCYNWAQTKNYSYNWQFDLPGPADVVENLINREEDFLRSNFHYEATWLKSSTDTDRDGLPDDCDAQVCGDAQVSLGAPPICSNATTGLNQCEECDKNKFSPTTICDIKNPIPSSTGTYRDIYPFNTTDINLRFVAHFNDTANADGRAKTFVPTASDIDPLDYVQGAYNMASMGNAITLSPASILKYPPSAYNPAQGTIQMWVKPLNGNVNPINIMDAAENIVKPFPITWNQNDWHMLTASYSLKYEDPVTHAKTYSYIFYFDGVRQMENAELPGLSGDLDIPAWLSILGLKFNEAGNPLDVALDEFAIFNNPISDESIIRAFYDAMYNQCADSKAAEVTKYMVDNFCASCNSQQCQIKVLRGCEEVTTGNVSLGAVSDTEFMWVSNTIVSTVTQMSVLSLEGHSIGDIIHEYKICEVNGGNPCAGGATCPTNNLGKTYCTVDYAGPGAPAVNPAACAAGAVGCNTTCSNTACAPIAGDPSRTAVNVDEGTAWIGYRGAGFNCVNPGVNDPATPWDETKTCQIFHGAGRPGVALFDSKKGLVKFCDLSIPAPAGNYVRGVAIDRDGNAWVGTQPGGTDPTLWKFDKSNNNCTPVVKAGGAAGAEMNVYGLAMDSNNNLWVSDTANQRVWRIDNVIAMTQNTILKAGNCTGVANAQGWLCHYWSTPWNYGIAVDLSDRAWVGRSCAVGNPGCPGVTLGTYVIDPGLANGSEPPRTTGDLSNVSHPGIEVGGRMLVDQYIYNTNSMTYSDTLEAGGVSSGDSSGSIWVIAGLDAVRLNSNGDHYVPPEAYFASKHLNPNAPPNNVGTMHYMYSDFIGLNRAMVFRKSKNIYPPDSAYKAYDTVSVSWSGRWGKILYEPINTKPPTTDVEVYVYVTDDISDFNTLANSDWIPAKEFNKRIPNFGTTITAQQWLAGASGEGLNKTSTAKGEIVGKYMKVKVVLMSRDKTFADPQVAGVRVTCRDNNGKNICQ